MITESRIKINDKLDRSFVISKVYVKTADNSPYILGENCLEQICFFFLMI